MCVTVQDFTDTPKVTVAETGQKRIFSSGISKMISMPRLRWRQNFRRPVPLLTHSPGPRRLQELLPSHSSSRRSSVARGVERHAPSFGNISQSSSPTFPRPPEPYQVLGSRNWPGFSHMATEHQETNRVTLSAECCHWLPQPPA